MKNIIIVLAAVFGGLLIADAAMAQDTEYTRGITVSTQAPVRANVPAHAQVPTDIPAGHVTSAPPPIHPRRSLCPGKHSFPH